MADEHRLNVQVDYGVVEFLARVIDLFAHEYAPVEMRVVGDESFQLELCRLDVADVLCQSYGVVVDTVDERAKSLVGAEGNVVKSFHKHALYPHEKHGNDVHRYNLPSLKRNESQFAVPRIDNIMEDKGKEARQTLGESHTLKVDERRIAYDAGIGVEHTETDEVENHVNQRDGAVIIKPEYKYS